MSLAFKWYRRMTPTLVMVVVLRGLFPSGFMPSDEGFLRVQLCTANGIASVLIPLERLPDQTPDKGHQSGDAVCDIAPLIKDTASPSAHVAVVIPPTEQRIDRTQRETPFVQRLRSVRFARAPPFV